MALKNPEGLAQIKISIKQIKARVRYLRKNLNRAKKANAKELDAILEKLHSIKPRITHT